MSTDPAAGDIEEAPVGRVLVFVNPHSGAGKSLKTFRQRVEPRLKKNHIDYELIITTGPNHAKTVVRSREDLCKFNGVIILSGDGLVFEVINGLVERPDRACILPCLPIGVVPSGSGNGLLSSLFFSRGEPLKNPGFTERAIEISCSPAPHAQAVNLIHVQTDQTNFAAFLSVGWGLMADIGEYYFAKRKLTVFSSSAVTLPNCIDENAKIAEKQGKVFVKLSTAGVVTIFCRCYLR
ncbi:diacylglycerol kinase catalytic domain protein [Oesophagostomum dentatum]|uniref:Diacylglycerol kinase catalytic domain protein n=1 Tax=Oesophagostomum dentatum TaxID=61180 RepID=A0A0B1TIZ1_OESDE|nr:diacylglycerol kinase catalytic domain protein [Oesophagostomum dentatum]